MTDWVMRLAAYALLVGFLGILVWFVPRFDLGAVVAVTLVCAGYDLFVVGRRTR
jgi:hypothetical protein